MNPVHVSPWLLLSLFPVHPPLLTLHCSMGSGGHGSTAPVAVIRVGVYAGRTRMDRSGGEVDGCCLNGRRFPILLMCSAISGRGHLILQIDRDYNNHHVKRLLFCTFAGLLTILFSRLSSADSCSSVREGASPA